MGLTNYQHALRKKYSALTGERDLLLERIGRIRQEQALLPELEARAAKLDALVKSAAMLLQEDSDQWEPQDSPPVRPWTHSLPIPFGTCGRRALEVLRTADRAMTVREITLEVLRQVGEVEPDRATLQKAQNAVDSSLRSRRGRGVESSDKYPAQWRSAARSEIEFDP
ncbi:hypothetical protein EB810_13525 [Altererythrobacter sp. FM1]|uniref:hypothetical protein n=1 Tax=Tsuneonella flava TaxID=2055955 RepID=UPI000C8086F7|nr:hypothetical protein [Tsuneonella flava]ROT94095.1 hypothetical protein EB810_13525 [Altererythrobacter sp. FM1]